MLRSRQAKLKRDISLIDDILQDGEMSEAHLKMLVEKILVHEEDGKLDLEIRLKAPFRDHLDIFENGSERIPSSPQSSIMTGWAQSFMVTTMRDR